MVLDQPFQGLRRQVQPVEPRIAPLEPGDDAEGLQIVVEAAEPGQRLVERRLAGMAEGAVAEIVRERDRLRQILVDPQRPGDGTGDLRDLQGVGQPGAEMVALEVDEYLRLVFEAPERDRVDDPVAVALVDAAQVARGLRHCAAEAGLRSAGVRRERHASGPAAHHRPWRPFDNRSALPK